VPANETRVLRTYVMLPPGVHGDEDEDEGLAFAFRLTARDAQAETDTQQTTFAMPEDD
jgi:hypothetical protein